jgi:hypothetical protein
MKYTYPSQYMKESAHFYVVNPRDPRIYLEATHLQELIGRLSTMSYLPKEAKLQVYFGGKRIGKAKFHGSTLKYYAIFNP